MTTGKMNGDARRNLLDQGFHRFERVLSSDLLGRLRRVTDRILDGQTAEHAARTRSQGSMFPTTVDPIFAELIVLPAALDALRSLGYPHPTFTDGYIISKPGHSPRLFWHYDWFAWEDERSYAPEPPQVFFMYYLTETRRENGCLRVIPGSHIRHNPLHDLLREPHSRELGEAQNPDLPEFSDRPDEVDVPVAAGDLLIGDARVLHAAHANESGERRTLITLWYQPDFDAMPARMRAQMAAKTQPIPETWPAEAAALLRPLLPCDDGTATPYPRTLYRPPVL
ncbi:MAG: phytanoyl-CoA dioxygenase family protein [Capsulimonadales bacterium]|nr:phytanoyl-CoA dioxygenase family protein [Capsulimonadales bacterium]